MAYLVRSLRKAYSLDTLDTRFTTSSKTPIRRTVNGDGSTTSPGQQTARIGSQSASHSTSPPRWRTPEFFFYYFIFLTIPVLMFKTVIDVSKESDPNYSKFSSLLSPGWIPGRKVDNSDSQYASFRNNIPYMAIAVVTHPLLRILYDYITTVREPTSNLTKEGNITSSVADARLKARSTFDIIFALAFIVGLHGFSAFKILVILYLNFRIATSLPRNYIPIATWLFNIGILFGNELCHGYRFSTLAQILSPTPLPTGPHSLAYNWGTWLDSFGGLIPRWEVLFKVTILRLISFNLDYYWSLEQRGSSPVEKKQLDPAALSERDRLATPSAPGAYTLFYYVAYVLYPPLYLAGPIITFNDYIAQNRFKSPSITAERTVLYAVRFLLALMSMELILHFIYAVAISKSNPDWSIYSPFQLSMLGYFNLHIIWLKLLLPWRFFRLWALLDGIDPPENMVRCMSDNFSALAFWRGWHRSFNRWIVRYMYVPLGGSGRGTGHLRSVMNLLGVFMFVALWHDISMRLLTWSWLIVLFILPELLCSTLLFPARNYQNRPNTYRVLRGIGAVGNILMMMAANLVGFAVGLDGLQGLVKGIVDTWKGQVFFVAACGTLFVGVQVMFEIREEEARNGINLKC